MLEGGNSAVFTAGVRSQYNTSQLFTTRGKKLTCHSKNTKMVMLSVELLPTNKAQIKNGKLWICFVIHHLMLRIAKLQKPMGILLVIKPAKYLLFFVSVSFCRSQSPRLTSRPWTRSRPVTKTSWGWKAASRSFMTCLLISPCWWKTR